MDRAVATLSSAALRHNLAQVRRFAPNRSVAAVIKADGYGHGLLAVAHGLAAADAFAVATLAEALTLREAGYHHEIILLEGVFEGRELAQAVAARLTCVLHQPYQLELLREVTAPLTVWVKLDSGMHRLGFPLEQIGSIEAQLRALPLIQCAGWMTHFANADDPTDPTTAEQWQRFTAACGDRHPYSAANSAAVVAWPATHGGWVRPGLMLYGISPLLNQTAAELGLQPVMSLTAPIIAVADRLAGDRIGYGGSGYCERAGRVGVVAIGYGDGYPRHLPSGTPLRLRGREVRLLGRVSMDMVVVDLSEVADAAVGERVTLWGEGLPIERIATYAATIPYELTCRLTARVVRRVVA